MNTYSPFPSEQTGLPSHGPHQKPPADPEAEETERLLGRVSAGVPIARPGHGRQHGGIEPDKKQKRSRQTLVVQTKETLSDRGGDGTERKSEHAIRIVPRRDRIISHSASPGSIQPKPCRHRCVPDEPKPERFITGSAGSLPVEFKNTPGTETQLQPEKEKPRSGHKNKIVSGAGPDGMDFMTSFCQIPQDKMLEKNWNRTKLESLPWFSRDDLEKLDFLARATVQTKARLSGHGQVLQVGLGHDNHSDHSGLCQKGKCALIKRPDDWIEVLAFHLDRILGLNRSLPAVLRTFHSNLLPYKYTSSSARPVVWWDPDLQHLADDENDQNSFLLTWAQYQTLLRARCGVRVPLNSSVCVGVHHEEWGRLALFDFLLQVRRCDHACT